MLTEKQLVHYVIDFLFGLRAWLYVLDSQDVSTCKKEKHLDVNHSWSIFLFFYWFGFDRTTFLATLVIWCEILLRIYLKVSLCILFQYQNIYHNNFFHTVPSYFGTTDSNTTYRWQLWKTKKKLAFTRKRKGLLIILEEHDQEDIVASRFIV